MAEVQLAPESGTHFGKPNVVTEVAAILTKSQRRITTAGIILRDCNVDTVGRKS